MEMYIKALQNYANFDGRASRKAYWHFVGMNFLITIAMAIVAGIALGKQGGVVTNIYSLATFIPAIAVAVRRMHDTNHSGWWMLVPIYSFILLCRQGDGGDNDFGPPPEENGPAPTTQNKPIAVPGGNRVVQMPGTAPKPAYNAANISQLAKLNELKKAGKITEEQFEQEKQKLLAS